ncbi:MAG: helix-turn-helix transcriptional regulator [Eubacterium sp.]|nr:helix-turn-helix transcriptional regulator [Eubacterium sp.]
MNEKPSEWCKAVKKTMVDKGVSVRQLAEKTGYCYSTVLMVVNGRYSSGGRREIENKIDSALRTVPRLPRWYADVKNAMRDKGMSVKQLAEETGYSITVVSSIINGRYSRRNYQVIAGEINRVLGTDGLPERIYVSDEWYRLVKSTLSYKEMSVGQLAQAAGITRDKMSALINGKIVDQQIMNTVSHLLDIALPEASSGMSKL